MSAVSARIEDQKFRRLRCGSNVGLLTAHGDPHQFGVAQLLNARHAVVEFGDLRGLTLTCRAAGFVLSALPRRAGISNASAQLMVAGPPLLNVEQTWALWHWVANVSVKNCATIK